MAAPAPGPPPPAGLLDDDDTLPPLKRLDENVLHTTQDSTKELAGRIFKAEGITRDAFMKFDIVAKNRLMYRASMIITHVPGYMSRLRTSVPLKDENPFIEKDTMAFRAIYNCLTENKDVLGRVMKHFEWAEKMNAQMNEEETEWETDEDIDEEAEKTKEKPEESETEENHQDWDGPAGDDAYSLICKLLADNPEVTEVFIREVERKCGFGEEHVMVLNSLNEWAVVRERLATVFRRRSDSSGRLYHYRT
ncbi:hypothetical protein M438DRAFT_401964 [Aureobasidium pullulans EXF-150]|uniref:Uncharacterized protein n=1 Tax=Aureobasidium pullulans EXF-150 TaxID=1043002 RepID=A0A074XWT5_AURPU|nr:uncharacterized protein M438DRAFT_401964 [Aureobasidium pullulans EXF-150]KEQ89955.1 hypothetical protein M438DRAFT_401964 [Aureobasidium pullulans EXF-150]